jgi:hypothetical protein
MGFLKGIGKIVKKVGGFIKKGVSFANKILNGPLGKIASMIPGIGQFVKGAQMVVGAADTVLNKKGGFGAVLKGLAGNLLGGAAGGALSKIGLGSLQGILGKATQAGGSSGLLDGIKSIMSGGNLGKATGMLAQGSLSNMQQLGAFNLASVFKANGGSEA